MFALIAAAALTAVDVPPASSDDNRLAYQAAKAAAGRSPDDQVRLAYWCEAHGLTAERMRHLAQAVLADPNNATARGLLGLVSRANRWVRPDAVADQVKQDDALAATLADYDARRSAAPYTAEGQWTLAHWAEDRGLADQARAHYNAVVRLDPRRDAVWKKLGYKKHEGRWATDAEIAIIRADAEAQKAADKKWRPLLEKWKAQLARPATRDEAEAGLLSITDPRAVRHIDQLFLAGSTPHQAVALRTLGQIDSAAASRLITQLAILGDDPNVRRAAVEMLRQRDPRDYADLLIRGLRERIEYEITPVGGAGSVGGLLVKESKRKIQRLYATPAVPNYLAWLTQVSDGAPTLNYYYQSEQVDFTQSFLNRPLVFTSDSRMHGTLQVDTADQAAVRSALAALSGPGATNATNHQNMPQGNQPLYTHRVTQTVTTSTTVRTPILTQSTIPLAAMVAEYQRSAFVAQQQIARDAATIDTYNRQVNESNDRLTTVLRTVSGEDHGADAAAWTGWMLNLSGYAMTTQPQSYVPTYTVDVPLAYQPQAVPITQADSFGPSVTTQTRFSSVNLTGDCFGAGTLVRTLTGPRPIETLHMGDMVLTQSTNSGALNYQPILMVHHNPPSPTFRVKLGDDAVVTSPFHRFWKVGQGWVMARDIKVGDRLRLLSGTAAVEEFTAGDVQLVYNLDIAEDADFFAGSSAVLVHDNTLLDSRLVPFDLPQADPKTVAAR